MKVIPQYKVICPYNYDMLQKNNTTRKDSGYRWKYMHLI